MAGINISFVSDVRAFLKGTRDIQESMNDVGDALDDLSREAERKGDKIGDALTDAGKEAGRASEAMERTFRQNFDKVTDHAKDAGRTIERATKEGTDKASEGMDSLKQNTAQNAKEMGASFNDVESALDGIQGLAAEALEGFGPAGVAAGVVAAAGIGIAQQALQQAADKANEMTEAAAAWSLEWSESDAPERLAMLRDRWREVATALADVKSWFEPWQDRAITNVERIAEAARQGTLDVGALYDAFNDADPIRRVDRLNDVLAGVNDTLDRLTDAQHDYNREVRTGGERDDEYIGALTDKKVALEQVRTVLEDETATAEAAAEIARALAEAEGLTVEQYQAKEQAAARALAAQESYTAAIQAAADPVSVYSQELSEAEQAARDAATAAATASADISDTWEDFYVEPAVSVQEMIDNWLNQAQTQAEFEEDLRVIANAGGVALAEELRAQGPEVAGAAADALANAGPGALGQAIAAHGQATGGGVARAIADGLTAEEAVVQTSMVEILGRLPTTVTVNPVLDRTQFDRDIRRLQDGTYEVRINGRVTGMRYE